jgi:hypothetical protein
LFHPRGAKVAETSLTETEFANIVKAHPRSGAAFTVILECCFSGGFDRWWLKYVFFKVLGVFGVRSLHAATPPRWRKAAEPSGARIRSFGSVSGYPSTVERPLVVAACRPGRLAAAIRGRNPGMVFSGKAIPEIRRTPRITHVDLLRKINPVARGNPPQYATLIGDDRRDHKEFFT